VAGRVLTPAFRLKCLRVGEDRFILVHQYTSHANRRAGWNYPILEEEGAVGADAGDVGAVAVAETETFFDYRGEIGELLKRR
jgi:hypothetical protein